MGLHPRLEDNGEERWQHLFSVALRGLLGNPSIVSMDGMRRINLETVMRLAKEVADKAVTIKPE